MTKWSLAITLAALSLLVACSRKPANEASDQDRPTGVRVNMAPPSRYAFDVARPITQTSEEKYRQELESRPEKLSLTLQSIGDDSDKHYVRVTLTNNGPKPVLVVPIQPIIYNFERKNADGSEQNLMPIPPIDYMFDEETLVRLYPDNSLTADFAFDKSWILEDADYKVVVYGIPISIGAKRQWFHCTSDWTRL